MTLSEIFDIFGTPFDANNDPFFAKLKNKEEEIDFEDYLKEDLEDYYDLENDVNASEWFEDRQNEMRKNAKTIESEHYILTLKTRAAIGRYTSTLIEAFESGVELEESSDNMNWTKVIDCYFYPKGISYRVAP